MNGISESNKSSLQAKSPSLQGMLAGGRTDGSI